MGTRTNTSDCATPNALNQQEDLHDVITAHSYRLSLNEGPNQSNFRVIALVFYDLKPPVPFESTPARSSYDIHGHTLQQGNSHIDLLNRGIKQDGRRFVVGTNEEPCHMGGSICAERAALVQLRFIPNLDRVTKIVIATDAETEVMPGMLCREFMASLIPWDTPIILAGSVCHCCGLNISASKVWGQENGSFAAQSECAGICFASFRSKKKTDLGVSGMHDFLQMKTNVKELYPYPSPFTKLSSKQSVELGIAFSSRSEATQTARRIDRSEYSETENEEDTIIYVNGPSKKTHQKSINEYVRNQKVYKRKSLSTISTGDISDDSESALSESPVRPEEKRKLTDTGDHQKCAESSKENSMLTQLLAEHVLKSAKKAAQNDNKSLHPIQYGAAVLFSDGTISTSHQKQSQEYGCTLDAVTQLAPIMEQKLKQTCFNHDTMIKVILLVQSDQYGIAHAPFAPARAYLTEYGYNDTYIVIHDSKGLEVKDKFGNRQSTKIVKVRDLAPHTLGLGSDILNSSKIQNGMKSQL